MTAALLAAGPTSGEREEQTEASKRPGTADSEYVLLQITRLTGGLDTTIRLGAKGKLERWEGSRLVVHRVGSLDLSKEETSRLFALANSVPAGRNMGTGVEEGDIYLLVNGAKGTTSVFLEPLAPDALKQVVTELARVSDAVDLVDTKDRFLRSEPVERPRAERLKARIEPHVMGAFDTSDRELLGATVSRPYEFVRVSRAACERILELTEQREFFLALEDSTWVQVGIWYPVSRAAADDSEFVLLQITPLTGGLDTTIRLGITGRLERWEGSRLVVHRVGSLDLSKDETSRLFALVNSVPAGRNMGTGVEEGDIYLLVNGRKNIMSLFLEPLAPDALKRVVAEMTRVSDAADLVDNKDRFLRAEPVQESRAKRLKARIEPHAMRDFDPSERELLGAAVSRPYDFIRASRTACERILERTEQREFFIALEDSTWVQVGLWWPR